MPRILCQMKSDNYANLVVLVFFLYKTCESLLHPIIRLHIYNVACHLIYESEGATWLEATQFCHFIHINRTDLMDRHITDTLIERMNSINFTISLENKIQILAADYLLIYRLLLYIPTIILAFICGDWSDRVGRIPPMFLPSFGAIIATFVCCVAVLSPLIHSVTGLGTMFFGIAVYGFFGKSSVLTMACNTYLTEVTSEESRTVYFGRLLGMNFIGICFGSFLISLYSEYSNIEMVFFTVSVVHCIIIALVIFVIPESKSENVELGMKDNYENLDDVGIESSSKSHEFITHNDEDEGYFLFRNRPNGARIWLILLTISSFTHQLCKAGESDTLLLLFKHTPLNWTRSTYGYYMTFFYAAMGLNLIFTLPFLRNWCTPRDTTLIIIGLVSKLLRLTLVAIIPTNSVIFTMAIVGSAGGFIVSSVRSLTTKLLDSNEYGKSFSLAFGIDAASNLVGPILFNYIYIGTVKYAPTFFLYLASFLNVLLLIFFVCMHIKKVDMTKTK